MKTHAEACDDRNKIRSWLAARENESKLATVRQILDKIKRGKLSPREAIRAIKEVCK